MLILITVLLGLCLIHWIITQYVYSRLVSMGSRVVLFPLIGPGIIIHELSHAIICACTLASDIRIKLFDFNNTSPQFGGVRYRHTSNPVIRLPINFLVGIAPLPGALLCMFALTKLLIPEYLLSMISVSITKASAYTIINMEFWLSLADDLPALFSGYDPGVKMAIWMLAVGLISHGAAPSIKDYKLAMPFGILLMLVLLVFGNSVVHYRVEAVMEMACVAMVALIIPLLLWVCFMAFVYQVLRLQRHL